MRETTHRTLLACLSLTTLVVLLVLVGSCSRPDRTQYSEVILFSTQGTTPFSDYIWTIQPDGSDPKPLLSPVHLRSYAAATGNYLRKAIIVSVHQSETGETVEDHLFLFWPGERRWRRLITEDLIEGIPAIAPDDMRVAFVATQKERPGNYRIWLTDTESGKVQKISEDEEGTWDSYPGWHPNGKELAFLRFKRTTEGLTSSLLVSRIDIGSARVLLSSDNAVLSFCYAPDGKRIAIWTKTGLEILDLSDMSRRVIVPIERLKSSYRFPADNLSWSRMQDKLVYVIMNAETKAAEMWTISSDGTDATKIHSSQSGTIQHLSFVQK